MGDIALRRLQLGLEGGYTTNANSVYNGGSPVVATRRLAPEKGMGVDFKPVFENLLEARGNYAGSYFHILQANSAAGKFSAAVYPDDQVYIGKMLVSGAPTWVTLPNAPISLMAATALSSGGNSLTTQPNNASDVSTPGSSVGKMLAVTLSNAAADTTAVDVTITGTDVFGNALVEVLHFSAGTTTKSALGGGTGALSCTLWTTNYFKTVNASGITSSAQPVGDQIAVGAVNAFFYTFKPDMGVSTCYSATSEYFDGSAAWQVPGMVLEKGTWNAQIGKSFKFDTSYQAQKKVQLVAGAGSIDPLAATGAQDTLTNLPDNLIAAISTYQTLIYADPLGTAPGTTQIGARLSEFKLDVDNKVKLGKTADGSPYPTFVARDYYGDAVSCEMTLLFQSFLGGTSDPSEVAHFLNSESRVFRGAFPGVLLPCGQLTGAGGWPTPLQTSGKGGYYGAIYDIAGKLTELTEGELDGRMAMKVKLVSEVDVVSMQTPYQMLLVSRVNPNVLG